MNNKTWFGIVLIAVILLAACDDPPSETAPDPLPELPVAKDLQTILEDTLAGYEAGKGISAAVILLGYQPWVGVSGISHKDTSITPETVFYLFY